MQILASLADFADSLSGVITILGLLGAVLAYLSPWLFPSPLRDLVGVWYTYGYFHTRNGDPVFYKEKSTISHFWLWPWVLRTVSEHEQGARKDIHRYTGFCWYRSIYVYFLAHEPIFDDTTFEIYRRVMDSRGSNDFLIGLHMAKSYDETVLQSSLQIMSKLEFVPPTSDLSDEIREQREMKIFKERAKQFADLADNPCGLLLLH